MAPKEIMRKTLDNREYVELRQVTEKIAHFLNKRMTGHMEALRQLFIARKLLGTYIKSAINEEVPRADKAFALLQERYASICEKPFGLTKKLYPPLPPISNNLDAAPFKYPVDIGGQENKTVNIVSPTKWILSYRSDCSLERLKAMLAEIEIRQLDEMRQTLINHITMGIFIDYYPSLKQLLEDLRYTVEIRKLVDLGNLPVVVLKAPIETFLPPDDFVLQITQLSGIDAFQEIIDPEAVENITDTLKEEIRTLIR